MLDKLIRTIVGLPVVLAVWPFILLTLPVLFMIFLIGSSGGLSVAEKNAFWRLAFAPYTLLRSIWGDDVRSI